VKVAKGLRLGYYRGAGSGTWIGSRYRNQTYETVSLGRADDNVTADNIRVFDYWQAQDAPRDWSGQQTLIDEGLVRASTGTLPSMYAVPQHSFAKIDLIWFSTRIASRRCTISAMTLRCTGG
jgi:hypothetical protein